MPEGSHTDTLLMPCGTLQPCGGLAPVGLLDDGVPQGGCRFRRGCRRWLPVLIAHPHPDHQVWGITDRPGILAILGLAQFHGHRAPDLQRVGMPQAGPAGRLVAQDMGDQVGKLRADHRPARAWDLPGLRSYRSGLRAAKRPAGLLSPGLPTRIPWLAKAPNAWLASRSEIWLSSMKPESDPSAADQSAWMPISSAMRCTLSKPTCSITCSSGGQIVVRQRRAQADRAVVAILRVAGRR